MNEEFWQERWARDEIGFHLKDVNPYLRRQWPALDVAIGSRVLVPLCGKSLDLAWLAGQGLQVVGVELSEKAVEAFFAEHQLEPEIIQRGEFRLYRSGTIEIFCGDLFALTSADLQDCRALYDRAALIALPEEMRRRYVAHLTAILPAGCAALLVTLDYPQAQMDGPPFAISDALVHELYDANWRVELLEEVDALQGNWKFIERGLSRLDERAYRLQRLA